MAQGGRTSLHIAAQGGHDAFIEWLLDRCPQLIERVDNVSTAQCLYVWRSDSLIVSMLLTQNGFTALHLAALKGHTSTARLLVARCPQLVDRVDNVSVCLFVRTILCLTRMCSQNEGTAVDWARDMNHYDTAAFLEVRPRHATPLLAAAF